MRWLLLSTLILAGCDEDPPPPPPTDAGPTDAGPGSMDAMVDGAVDPDGGDLDGSTGDDATVADGGGDGSVSVDAGGDAARTPFDSGPLPDSALPDPCTLIPPGSSCTAGTCPVGEICLSNGCGSTLCLPAGGPCAADSDCASGSTCIVGACVRTGGGCSDSRDCPTGFSCDAGSCVDRRITCGIGLECPQGFYCDTSLSRTVPFCVRANPPCVSSAGCLFFGMCRDVTGTGATICHISTGPDCRTNADCGAGEVCGSHPEFIEAMCGPFGPCATSADCASGSSCTDLWGDGVPECAPAGGSCSTQADCSAGAVCAVPFAGGPPSCLSRPI